MSRLVAIVAAIFLLASTTGCTMETGDLVTGSTPPATATVAVARADINPVLSIPATVQGGASFEVTADHAGVFDIDASGNPVIVAGGDSFAQGPPDGHLVQNLVVPGDQVVVGLPIAVMVFSGFVLRADVSGADLLRFLSDPVGARGQVTGAGAPFPCSLVDPRPSPAEDGTSRFVACRIPSDQQVIAGLTGLMAVSFPGKSDVLALPVEAVAGTTQSAAVFLRDGSDSQEIRIEVGITDGISIEVISGLTEGQEVLLPSPTLLGP